MQFSQRRNPRYVKGWLLAFTAMLYSDRHERQHGLGRVRPPRFARLCRSRERTTTVIKISIEFLVQNVVQKVCCFIVNVSLNSVLLQRVLPILLLNSFLAKSRRMESEDHAAVHEQPQQSRVHVFVRPLDDAASRYADARICSSTLFDVILHLALPRSDAAASSAGSQSASSSPTFLHVQRCLHDFAQLERDVRSEARVADTAAMVLPAIVDEIRAYVTTKRSSPSHDDDGRTTLHSKDLLEARFAWQLEHFLSALVGDPVIVRRSHALKQFLHGDVADRMLHDFGEDEKETYAHLVETLMAGVHSQSQHREHVQDERIASGCSFEHAVQIKVTDTEEEEGEEEGVSQNARLVLWKFASRGDRVYFSARFSEQQDGQQATHGDPYSNADPYSSANAYGGDATPAGACGSAGSEDGDGALRMERPLDRYMVQYRTRYAFPTEQLDERFIYGHFVAKASGALVLEWANEDTSSILSKPLDFHVHVIPLAQTGIAGDTFLKFLDAADGQEDPLWVHRLLQKSTVVSVEEVLDAPDSDEEEELRSFGDVPVAASYSESEKLARLREEKHFHAQRSKELEDRVVRTRASSIVLALHV